MVDVAGDRFPFHACLLPLPHPIGHIVGGLLHLNLR